MGKYRVEATVEWTRDEIASRSTRQSKGIPLEYCGPNRSRKGYEQWSIGEAKDLYQLQASLDKMDDMKSLTVEVKSTFSVQFLAMGWKMESITLRVYEGNQRIKGRTAYGPTRGHSSMQNGIEQITFEIDDDGWSMLLISPP